MSPVLAQLGLGILGGLFGGSHFSPEQKQAMRLQKGVANRLWAYGTGVPGSDPQERAALAQALAVQGEQFANQRNQFFAQTRPEDVGLAAPDQIGNLLARQMAGQMSIQGQHLMDSFSRRRDAMMQAAQVASGLFNQAGQGQSNGVSEALGGISQQIAYNQQKKKLQGGMTAPQSPLDKMQAAGGSDIFGKGDGFTALNAWNQAQKAGVTAPGNEPDGQNSAMNQNRATAIDRANQLLQLRMSQF